MRLVTSYVGGLSVVTMRGTHCNALSAARKNLLVTYAAL